MNNDAFLKWGAISAIVFAVLQGAVYLTGIEFRAFVPLFSLALIFRLMAALAGYELLAKTHYGLARAGLGFAFLAIIMMFLEAAVWGARSASSVDVADMVALFDSLHLMVLWFVALWVLCWGLAFIQESGAARALGALFIFHVFVNLLRYFTIQFEIGGIIAGIRDVVGPLRARRERRTGEYRMAPPGRTETVEMRFIDRLQSARKESARC
jgi:hypothetical protein